MAEAGPQDEWKALAQTTVCSGCWGSFVSSSGTGRPASCLPCGVTLTAEWSVLPSPRPVPLSLTSFYPLPFTFFFCEKQTNKQQQRKTTTAFMRDWFRGCR